MVRSWLPVAALTLLSCGTALGHAKLQSSAPAANSLLKAPKSLSLTFNEPVKLAVLTVSTGGKPVPLSVDRSADAAREVSVALPALPPGVYQVDWSALSSNDGHVVRGRFSFTVTAG